ncbi:1889_t:CDS:2, partial [Acaulospora morrowiae]
LPKGGVALRKCESYMDYALLHNQRAFIKKVEDHEEEEEQLFHLDNMIQILDFFLKNLLNVHLINGVCCNDYTLYPCNRGHVAYYLGFGET